MEACSLAEASLENLQALLNKLAGEYVPAYKHIAQKPIFENRVEISFPRLYDSAISGIVQTSFFFQSHSQEWQTPQVSLNS